MEIIRLDPLNPKVVQVNKKRKILEEHLCLGIKVVEIIIDQKENKQKILITEGDNYSLVANFKGIINKKITFTVKDITSSIKSIIPNEHDGKEFYYLILKIADVNLEGLTLFQATVIINALKFFYDEFGLDFIRNTKLLNIIKELENKNKLLHSSYVKLLPCEII